MICSFECTFCRDCVGRLQNVCRTAAVVCVRVRFDRVAAWRSLQPRRSQRIDQSIGARMQSCWSAGLVGSGCSLLRQRLHHILIGSPGRLGQATGMTSQSKVQRARC